MMRHGRETLFAHNGDSKDFHPELYRGIVRMQELLGGRNPKTRALALKRAGKLKSAEKKQLATMISAVVDESNAKSKFASGATSHRSTA